MVKPVVPYCSGGIAFHPNGKRMTKKERREYLAFLRELRNKPWWKFWR